MAVISGTPLWILSISVLLLAPPLDTGVSVGDFSPDVYTGKLNPLADGSIVVEDIFFPSHGETCHAWLYTKSATTEGETQPKAAPVVVMAPGFGTQKDFGLDRYAERFVQAGYAVFLFDYRNFAASTGTPRNWISPKRHIEDYHAALDYLSQSSSSSSSSSSALHDKVDTSRILLWGTSFSGGHVLEIASQRSLTDQRIRGVVSQVPHLSGKAAALKGLQTRGVAKMLRLALAALQDKARQWTGLPPVTAKIIGSGSDLALMSVTPEDKQRYLDKQPSQTLGGWINQTPARILLEVRFYNPIDTLKSVDANNRIQVPVFLIGASLDDLCPPDLIEEASTLIPGSKFIVREGTHFQIYEPQNWKYVVDEMVQFYNHCLLE